MDKQGKVKRIAEVLSVFTGGKMPTDEMVSDWISHKNEDLQIYMVNNTTVKFQWTTGVGLIESAIHIVNEAIANGNLK